MQSFQTHSVDYPSDQQTHAQVEMDALLNMSSATFFEIYLLANVVLLMLALLTALLIDRLRHTTRLCERHTPLILNVIVIDASEVSYTCWMYSAASGSVWLVE